ncbi:SIR2 family protein [Brevundimonas sp.]|uniref:SIR2 family protein n=1 Tax=Brevundimonas sp. TaxID=1871086 RepID=UPI00356695C5
MPASPSATAISVVEVLAKLDGEFAAVASAVENGEFALWVGSGISRNAPNLPDLIARGMEALRIRAMDPATREQFEPALLTAIREARADPDVARLYFERPFAEWPMAKAITDELWTHYSRLLDIRVEHQAADWMLWDGIDIRAAFAHPSEPAAEHLCIAILVLEGAVQQIASGNWDGFIEAAVARLSSGAAAVLQPVVDPDHLRAAAGKARLLKFHGCIVHATNEPEVFRKYLTGSQTQITEWAHNADFAAMVAAVTELATNLKTLVLGLSIQDANLQGVFAAAKRVHPWPWPCEPNAPGHIFCEDEIRDGQHAILKIVYGDAYNANLAPIEASAHIRAWGEQVLISLVLKLLTDKLGRLMHLQLGSTAIAGGLEGLSTALLSLRDLAGAQAVGDRTAAVNRAISLWSRLLSVFRTGCCPIDPNAYEVLSVARPEQLVGDQNARAAGLGSLAIGLALFQHGQSGGLWKLGPPQDGALTSGVIKAEAAWAGAASRPVFLVKSAKEAIALEQAGAFANDNAIVIHADDVWQTMKGASASSARRPRGAPGRTNRVETRHVSLEHILAGCGDFDELGARFVSEVTL